MDLKSAKDIKRSIIFLLILLSTNTFVLAEKSIEPKQTVYFELTDVNGNIWSSKELVGKVVVFNFWFSACPPCKREIPELNKLVDVFKDENIIFIAVSPDSESQVESFLSKVTFNYHIIPEGTHFINDRHISSFPTQLILNREGEIVKNIVGEVSYKSMKKHIERVL